MTSALIVVDIQKDFMPGGTLGIKEGDGIIPGINRVMRMFPLVIATKDYHPKHHVSFASSHPGRRSGEVVSIDGRAQNLWSDHCLQESAGSDLDPRLDKDYFDHIFVKGTNRDVDSYSTFFDNARNKSTGLHDYLRKNNVKKVFICGLATDFCVLFSAIDAIDLGYQVYIIKDLCKPVDLQPGDGDAALIKMENKGAKVIDSDQISVFL